ncbi:GNAT family N-acetyltransferase [Teichococcus aestuarii]|uniref:GNAT family N-acetyltransferase n=1 Tax=Teichococcus aestuarii TaxID=568898 RepID=UPI003614D350
MRGGERRKIGQCAVGISLRRRVFADSLQLLPEEQQLWSEAMQAVLGRLGAGEYHYGSQWSLEAPREADLAAIPGVTVTAVEPITVHAVSFREWSSWEAYLRGLSSNARRNAKRAQEQFADLAVEIRQGRETLRRWPALQALKSMLAERKQLDFRQARHFLRFAMRLMALRQNNFLAVARGGGEDMAAFAGIDFGPNTYFLESGARDTRNGTGWHLMLTMLQRAYGRAPGAISSWAPSMRATRPMRGCTSRAASAAPRSCRPARSPSATSPSCRATSCRCSRCAPIRSCRWRLRR